MRYSIHGKGMDVTESLREAIYTKFSKLDKFFKKDTEVQIKLSAIKGQHKVEAMIPMKHHLLRAEQSSDDMYASIDMVVDVLERMVRKYKTKISRNNRGFGGFTDAFLEEDVEEPERILISKSKRFAIKPMDIEEACIQMELIGHDFYVFRNADTYEVNVVYKRKDGTYGVIEPQF